MPDRRSSVRGLPLVLLLAVLLGAGMSPQPAAAPALSEQIPRILQEQQAERAFWGILVRDLDTGQDVYRQNADLTMLPASNQKLLTTAAALDVLGSDYRFETALYFDGRVDGTTLRGDLLIEGAGDPSFGSRMRRGGGDPIADWAQHLAAMGVTRFEGRIIGDDDVFDDAPYAEGWDIDYVTQQASRMLGFTTSGLSYRDNVVDVKITAAGAGDPATIETSPAGYVEVRNDLVTSGRSRGTAVQTDRALGTEQVTLAGSIHRNYDRTVALPVTNPTRFAAHSLKIALEEAGVAVDAEAVDVDDLEETLAYADAQLLFVHLSPVLSELLREVNKESNNFYAEHLFRAVSATGSADGSERRIKSLLAEAGASTDGLSIRDGSGLSRKNLITPDAMVELLGYFNEHSEKEAFRASLAEGGERRSTLSWRLHNVPVQAKTGSLEYVRALSGYATAPDGHTLAFAVFANNYTVPSHHVIQAIDEIVLALTGRAAKR